MSQPKLLMYGLLQGAEQKGSNWIFSLDIAYLYIIYIYIFEEKLGEIEHVCCFVIIFAYYSHQPVLLMV